ncbi:carboxypeptidase-like regulatory domain-containing protein [Methylomonas rhizoryzae]|uniref:carboxypeptidase-like regulatory domain-containing protein n=1 Tax=Methylomonas rhizoryzae TaxID=2608981 RepID=UPI001232786D|nr:carboxypeptidase-like regulatory domain-containing protein [Methylomonas rhizoryzae]
MKLKFIVPWLMLSFFAFAEDPPLSPQIQGEVRFVSGGIGYREREAMQVMRADYNLLLLFAEKGTGNYLSDVQVVVKDQSGHTVMETVADGPMLFAKLSPGHYSVEADHNGHSIAKIVNVGSQRQTSLSFAWPAQPGDQSDR